MAGIFQINDELYATFTFTNNTLATPALGDPGVVIVKLKKPDATTTTYTYGVDTALTKVAVGVFRFRETLLQSGQYHIRCEGSSGLTGAAEQAFDVDTSAF